MIMTMMGHVEHALGCLSLGVIAYAGGLAAHSLAADVRRAGWRRILSLAAGRIEPLAASDAPHASACLLQRRGDEAAAAPTPPVEIAA